MTDRTETPSNRVLSDPIGTVRQSDRLVTTPGDWPLAYHTVRNMKPVQIAGIIERRLRHAVVPRLPVDFNARYERRVPDELSITPEPIRANLTKLRESLTEAERARYREAASEAANGRFTFLDRAIDFGDRIDWNHERIDEYPRLWRLKLESFQGFEWLVLSEESASTVDDHRAALERQAFEWDAANPIGEGPYLRRSWIPHAVSLRVLHWCRYAAWCAGDTVTVPDRLLRLVYKNALFLENHVEHDIGGNHLIENAVALVAAGVLFGDHDTGWESMGLDLLEEAARKQFLADGGHFERSPMYHITVLRRYATAYDLLSSNELSTTVIETTAELALGFLSQLIKPGGKIPLLNDSAYGEAIEATTCLAYCRACSLTPTERSLHHPDGTGYRTLSTDTGTLLFDVGDVGPTHLPAHSHNDQLSVLLWVDGDPVLADTGVYDYEANERRQYARSVAAHNTAQYGGIEPIPIGGSFLMGKRTSVSVVDDDPGRIEARHSRRSIAGTSYEHRRTVATIDSGWEIADTVTGDPAATYTVRYHFHPTTDVCESSDDATEFSVRRDGDRIASVRFSGTDRVRLTQTPYFEEYGREQFRAMIALKASTGSDVVTRFSADTVSG
ncbi:alginate lyase family protein [Halobellus rarus]|uniref:Heparinase II/III family protein n=1 Tax=Halobellus rarus TaxID=1126237 RepID=A0ABD6CPW7_9EURY|nr:alginate lyase family protein [Halobellus rarus]